MAYAPDHGCKDLRDRQGRVRRAHDREWARVCAEHDAQEHIAQYVYTAQEYSQTFPEMRNGDIFMGSFGAEQ
jgi:predicted fused transcriptional regulator/phosphomethylpyrimidine kinase